MTPSPLPATRTIVLLGAVPASTAELADALAVRLPGHRIVVADEAALPATASNGSAFFLLVAVDPDAFEGADAQASSHRQAADLDHRLRAALASARLPFAVLHGKGPDRLVHALRALGLDAEVPVRPRMAALPECERCSEPSCEHRLFTDLLRQRAERTSASP
ncbi:hypothetical protein QTH87_11245 [Variovorax sp. J22P168]|uniref:hypothetical protein n=1 Tax=Variovorax jilinensis TaxID=3053513 RepID=UPI002574AA1D|nr:hypothetical protein [Variovorax sp. J22P168]MDM0013007.1 hypothetical protein [Variovorax sp. J22P168]